LAEETGYAPGVRLLAALVLLSLSILVLATLYLTGPERRCTVYTEIGPRIEDEPARLACLRSERTNAWERIRGAITGD
jgi:hypothetical protein